MIYLELIDHTYYFNLLILMFEIGFLSPSLRRASSVLQRNTKLYGPMNALNGDSSNSKSWNSEGNTESETYLLMKFDRPVLPVNLKLQFQAGFSAGSFSVHLYHDTADVAGTKNHIVEFECCDVHELQTFQLEELDFMLPVSRIKFVMNDFADFYGRVILYRIEVWGHPVDGEASIE